MKHLNKNSRRGFLKQSAKLGAILTVAPGFLKAASSEDEPRPKPGEGYTILFQGDSITDGNRGRNNDWNHVMGHGYQFIIASKLWYDHPDKEFKIFNRGISGNKITDLAARWQEDTLALKPDLLSILVGINDTAAFFDGDEDFSADQFESRYRSLLNRTKKEFPQIKLVLGEPFILPVGRVKEKWEQYEAEMQKRQEVVKKLADEFSAIHIKYQNAFNKALAKAPADYWIWDGVHPMPAGHELMAREWLKEVGRKLDII